MTANNDSMKTPFPLLIYLGWLGCGMTALYGYPHESSWAFIILLVLGGFIFGKYGPEWEGRLL